MSNSPCQKKHHLWKRKQRQTARLPGSPRFKPPRPIRRASRQLRFEGCEERQLLAAIVVNGEDGVEAAEERIHGLQPGDTAQLIGHFAGPLDLSGLQDIALIGASDGSTVIDAQRTGTALTISNSTNIEVHHLTLANGGGGGSHAPGGFLVQNSSATFFDVLVTGNQANVFGAGGQARGQQTVLNVVDSQFRDNSLFHGEREFLGNGADIAAVDGAQVHIDHSEFTGGQAWSEASITNRAVTAGGFTLFSQGGELDILNSKFSGIRSDRATVIAYANATPGSEVRGNLFVDNLGGVHRQSGAVIDVTAGSIVIANNTIQGHRALTAIRIGSNVDAVDIQGNILVDDGEAGSVGISAPPQVTASFNNVVGYATLYAGGVEPQDSFSIDPQLTSDYRLPEGSPLADVIETNKDWDDGTHGDLGAGRGPLAFVELDSRRMDYGRLKALAWSRSRGPHEPETVVPVPILDPPIGDTHIGLNSDEAPEVRTRALISQHDMAVHGLPRAGQNQGLGHIAGGGPVYIDGDGDGNYSLQRYDDANPNFSSPVIQPPVARADIPQAAQELVGLEVAARRAEGDYPLIYSGVFDDGYVRVIGFGEWFGASWRPLGIHDGYQPDEDFPHVVTAYVTIHSPDHFTVLYLAEGESWTIARRDDVYPGDETRVEVDAVFYPRDEIAIAEQPDTGPLGVSSMFLQSIDGATSNAFDSNRVAGVFDTTGDGRGDCVAEQELANPGSPSDFINRDLRQPCGGELTRFAAIAGIRDEQHFADLPNQLYHVRPTLTFDDLNSDVPVGLRTIVQGTTVEHNDNVLVIANWLENLPEATTPDRGVAVSYTLTANLATSLNEPPGDLTLSSTTVAENADTTGPLAVGTLSAVDPDQGDSHQFTLVDGDGADDNGVFQISGNTLQIKAGTTLDHETQDSYAIRLRATDNAGLAVEKSFVISVLDAVEDVVISLSIRDRSGNEITSIHQGGIFYLEIGVEHGGPGLWAAYTDVSYDPSYVAPISLVHAANYANGTSGSLDTPGEIDEFGGLWTMASAPGGGRFSLGIVTMQATALGELVFAANRADVTPEHDVVPFDSSQAVPAARIDYESRWLEVVPGWQNLENRFDVDGSGIVAPVDGLRIVIDLNTNGARKLTIPPVAPFVPPPFLDVSGDGYITPLDFLHFVNFVNSTPAGEGEGDTLPIDISFEGADRWARHRIFADLGTTPVITTG